MYDLKAAMLLQGGWTIRSWVDPALAVLVSQAGLLVVCCQAGQGQSSCTCIIAPVRGLQLRCWSCMLPWHVPTDSWPKAQQAQPCIQPWHVGAASPSVVLQPNAEVEDRCLATARDALQLLGHLAPVTGLDVVLCGRPHMLNSGLGGKASTRATCKLSRARRAAQALSVEQMLFRTVWEHTRCGAGDLGARSVHNRLRSQPASTGPPSWTAWATAKPMLHMTCSRYHLSSWDHPL